MNYQNCLNFLTKMQIARQQLQKMAPGMQCLGGFREPTVEMR